MPLVTNNIPIFEYTLAKRMIGITVGMFVLSILLSILILFLLRNRPLVGLWTLVTLSLGSLAGILIVLFYYGLTPVGIVVAVFLALLTLCVICYS